MFLTFVGAAGTVTGSKTLVEAGGSLVLVDCGMFQGSPAEGLRNRVPLAYDPGELDAVVDPGGVAHLDPRPLRAREIALEEHDRPCLARRLVGRNAREPEHLLEMGSVERADLRRGGADHRLLHPGGGQNAA